MAQLIRLCSARGQVRANVVFLHGLGGDALETWTSPVPDNSVWPKWLAEELPDLSIYSVGYDAPVSRWTGGGMHPVDLANQILSRLYLEDSLGDSELDLVGHSLGGLIIKLMVRRAMTEENSRKEAANFLRRLRKVVFLATPHTGSELANIGDVLRVLARPSPATKALARDDSYLTELAEGYRKAAQKYNVAHLTLTERNPLIIRDRKFFGFPLPPIDLGVIVKPSSADPGLASDPIPFPVDHREIAKPKNHEDQIYLEIRGFIARKVEPYDSIEKKAIDQVKDDTEALKKQNEELLRQNEELKKGQDKISRLVARALTAGATIPQNPATENAIAGAVGAAVAHAEAGDERAATALRLLNDGKVLEATVLFEEEAREKSATGNANQAAAAYRHLGAIAGLRDPKKARAAYATALELDPANAEGLAGHGWLQLRAGNIEASEKSYRALLQLDGKGADEHQLFWARIGLGDIALARGNKDGALALYREAEGVMQHLAESDAGNMDRQRDLSVSLGKIGEVLAMKEGHLPEALKANQRGLEIAKRLAELNPGDAELQRDVSVFYERIGDGLVQSNPVEALKFYVASHDIAKRLAAADTANAGLQRDLFVSMAKIGGLLLRQGDPAEALKYYRPGLMIAERLAPSDAGNTEWQLDLMRAYMGIAVASPTEALEMISKALKIAQHLHDQGRLAPEDQSIIELLKQRLALEGVPGGG